MAFATFVVKYLNRVGLRLRRTRPGDLARRPISSIRCWNSSRSENPCPGSEGFLLSPECADRRRSCEAGH